MSEALIAKAEAYAKGGAVTVTVSNADTLIAQIDGNTGSYTVVVAPAGSSCTCPANTLGHRVCSHIRAAELYERWGALWDAERRAAARQAARDSDNVVHATKEG